MILVGLLKGHIEATRDTTPDLARSYQKALNTLPSEVQKWTETIRPDNTSLSNQNQIIAFKFLNNIQSVVIKAHPKLDNLIPHLQVLGDYFIDTKKLPYDKIILEIDKINSMLKNHRNAGPFIKKTDPNIIFIENELKLLKKTAQSAHKIDKASAQTPAKNLKH